MRALVSVYDKEGILPLCKTLEENGIEIISTGGTYKFLIENGLKPKEISSITNFPEILEGRVKTLHPKIHGAILYRENKEQDKKDILEHNITPIDIVIVNLYPFENKLNESLNLDDLLEFIDIGGVTLIRAAAKNYKRVSILVDKKDYEWFIEKVNMNALSEKDRKMLAVKAFAYTSYYDSIIYKALKEKLEVENNVEKITIPLDLKEELRYGENPHQKGYIYTNPLEKDGIARARVIQGKQMSYNNYLDADSAIKLIREFPTDKHVCAIIKHNNPSGCAIDESQEIAYSKALLCDKEAAFGGIVIFNKEITEQAASLISEFFYEIIIAPSFQDKALDILSKKKNLRLVESKDVYQTQNIRSISGGYLLQDEDNSLFKEINIVSDLRPSEEDLENALFAFRVAKQVKSNAIVIAKHFQTIGIGAGNVSRVDSLREATRKARANGFNLENAILASDAFFPFRDSIDIAAKEGIKGVIQPGGSIRDKEVIEAVNEYKMFMIFTGMRHFKH